MAIVKGVDVKEMAFKALDLIKARDVVKSSDRVLIKPNYVEALQPETGVVTDPRIIESLIDFVEGLGVSDITIGEGGWGLHTAELAFKLVGLDKVARGRKVKLINLNVDKKVLIEIAEASALRKVWVAKSVLEATCIINVPKLKVHRLAKVSLGLKNLIGVMSPKGLMHEGIHEKIVDLASFLRPKITLIDGLVGSEVAEVGGKPVKMDIIISSLDMVAADAIGAAVMGISPMDVEHIRLAEERGLGVADLRRIEVLGRPLDKVMRRFTLPRAL